MILLVIGAVTAGTGASATPANGPERGPSGVHWVDRIPVGNNKACLAQNAVADPPAGVIIAVVTANPDTPDKPGCRLFGGRAPSVSMDGLVAYSVRGLRQVAAAPLKVPPGSGGCGDPMVVSPDGGRLVTACYSNTLVPGSPNRILVFDVRSLLAGVSPIAPAKMIEFPSTPAGLAAAGGGLGVVSRENPTGPAGDLNLQPNGLYIDAASDSVYVALAGGYGGTTSTTARQGPGSQDVYVVRVSLSTGRVAWALMLGQCSFGATAFAFVNGVNPNAPIFVVSTGGESKVVVGCLASRGVNPVHPLFTAALSNFVTLSGASALTYSIPLDRQGQPITERVAFRYGRPNTLWALADPEGDRIFWVSIPTSRSQDQPQPSAVVFDSTRDSYIGASTIGAPNNRAPALAVGGGRLYAVDQSGIRVLDATGTPPGQGAPSSAFPIRAHLAVTDPVTRRLFVVPKSDSGPDNVFEVFQDGVPSVEAPAPPDPDSNTSQVEERQGVTAAAFTGHGEATAGRIRLVGGTTGFAGGATFGVPSLLKAVDLGESSDYRPREVRVGEIGAVNLDTFAASAQAQAASADSATGSAVASGGWPFAEVACSGQEPKGPSRSYGARTSSAVSCDRDKQRASADSSAEGLELTVQLTAEAESPELPVAVGHGSSEAIVRRDAKAGLVSEVSSEARGIVAGPVTIGSVRSEAQCRAKGRSGTAECSYTRSITGVVGMPSGAATSCEQTWARATDYRPDSTSCDQLITELNKVQPGYLVFSIPAPDRRSGALTGSPGGYQAVAEREFYQHLEDDTLNFDDSKQIPGLKVLYVNDSYDQPSRLDMQLANVQADSHYGISEIPQVAPADGGGVGSAAPPLGSVANGAAETPDATGEAAPLRAADPNAAGPSAAGQGPPPSVAERAQAIVRRVLDGLRWLWRSPAEAVSIALLLTLLGGPLMLAYRRRRLELLGGT